MPSGTTDAAAGIVDAGKGKAVIGNGATNGQANRLPGLAEALDRAPSGDRQQTVSNGEAAGGRDQGGRFAKGNKSGRGNPFAKQVAMLRCELVNAVTRKDIRRLARSLLKKAKAGNIAAAKLLLSYCVGQPVQLCPTADGLEGSESLPGESIGMPSGSLSELLDKIETQFCPDLERERQQAGRYKLLMPQLADVMERAEANRREAVAVQAKAKVK